MRVVVAGMEVSSACCTLRHKTSSTPLQKMLCPRPNWRSSSASTSDTTILPSHHNSLESAPMICQQTSGLPACQPFPQKHRQRFPETCMISACCHGSAAVQNVLSDVPEAATKCTSNKSLQRLRRQSADIAADAWSGIRRKLCVCGIGLWHCLQA